MLGIRLQEWCSQKSTQIGFPVAEITLAYRYGVLTLKFPKSAYILSGILAGNNLTRRQPSSFKVFTQADSLYWTDRVN